MTNSRCRVDCGGGVLRFVLGFLFAVSPLAAQDDGIKLPRDQLVIMMADSATHHLCDEPYERWVAARQMIDFLRRRGLVYRSETAMHLTEDGVAVLSRLPPRSPMMAAANTFDRALEYYIPMSAIYFHCAAIGATHFSFAVQWRLPNGHLIAESDEHGQVTIYP